MSFNDKEFWKPIEDKQRRAYIDQVQKMQEMMINQVFPPLIADPNVPPGMVFGFQDGRWDAYDGPTDK